MKKILILAAVMFAAAACNKNPQNNLVQPAAISDQVIYVSQGDTGLFKMNTDNKQTQSLGPLLPDLAQYSGLPAQTQTSQGSRVNGFATASLDKSQFLVISEVVKDAGDGAIVSSQTYKCDVAAKKCGRINIPAEGATCWLGWNSQKNIFYGSNCSEAGETLFVAYDASTKVQHRIDVGAHNWGFFRLSPMLDKSVFVRHEPANGSSGQDAGNPSKVKTEVEIDDSNYSLAHPYDVFELPDLASTASSLDAVSWSKDEKKVVIATDAAIYIYDLDSKKLSSGHRPQAVQAGKLSISSVGFSQSQNNIEYVLSDFSGTGQNSELWIFNPADNTEVKLLDVPGAISIPNSESSLQSF